VKCIERVNRDLLSNTAELGNGNDEKESRATSGSPD